MGKNYPVINNRGGSYLTAWTDGALQAGRLKSVTAAAMLGCSCAQLRRPVACEAAAQGCTAITALVPRLLPP